MTAITPTDVVPADIDLADMDPAPLIAAARKVAAHAHAPYSGFGVGAAILLADGAILSGCNLENASYGLTLCAEAVTLGSVAARGGLRQVRAIAIVGGMLADGGISGTDPVRPCGRCRQMIAEAAHWSAVDIPVFCAGAEGEGYETHRISSLLPHSFGPGDLGLG